MFTFPYFSVYVMGMERLSVRFFVCDSPNPTFEFTPSFFKFPFLPVR
jgi:hypothetical protein